MARQGMPRGPRREIVRKIRDPNGWVIEEILACGHRVTEETLRALGRCLARVDRQRQQERCCSQCRETTNLEQSIGDNLVNVEGT